MELDGYQAHGTKLRLVTDKRRDRRLAALGWTVIRVTWDDLEHNPDELEADLRTILGLAQEGR